MKNDHISPEKLSEFLDDTIISQNDRQNIENHLIECQLCKKVYEDLSKTVNMLSSLKLLCITNPDSFITKTIDEVKMCKLSHNRNPHFKHIRIAAIAASVLIFTGLYFNGIITTPFDSGNYNSHNLSKNISHDSYDNFENRARNALIFKSGYSMDKTIDILRNNNAQLRVVSESYIDGVISFEDYQKARYYLNSSETRRTALRNRKYLLKVKMSGPDSVFLNQGWESPGGSHRLVRFRVYYR